jgi:hypothetical protein
MTRNARIKCIVRGVTFRTQEAEDGPRPPARATGNDSRRRQAKAEELESRLNQFARKIKDAISR